MNLKKNIRKILKEKFNNLDWIRDIEVDPLNSGTLMFISPIDTKAVNWVHRKNSNKEYVVLKITYINGDELHYDVLVDTMDNVRIGSTPLDRANKLFNTGYWRVLDNNIPKEYITPKRNWDHNPKITSRHFLPYIIFDGEKMNTDQLNESDDFQWIKDIEPSNYNPKVGDKIRVHNLGSEESFLNWLGMYVLNYKSGEYGPFIEGEVTEPNDDLDFCVREKNTGQEIFFPTYERISLMRLSSDYKRLDLLYEFI